MFFVGLKDAYFQTLIQPGSRPCLLDCLEWECLPVQDIVFNLSTAPKVRTRVFSGVKVASQEWNSSVSLPGWLIIAESLT